MFAYPMEDLLNNLKLRAVSKNTFLTFADDDEEGQERLRARSAAHRARSVDSLDSRMSSRMEVLGQLLPYPSSLQQFLARELKDGTAEFDCAVRAFQAALPTKPTEHYDPIKRPTVKKTTAFSDSSTMSESPPSSNDYLNESATDVSDSTDKFVKPCTSPGIDFLVGKNNTPAPWVAPSDEHPGSQTRRICPGEPRSRAPRRVACPGLQPPTTTTTTTTAATTVRLRHDAGSDTPALERLRERGSTVMVQVTMATSGSRYNGRKAKYRTN